MTYDELGADEIAYAEQMEQEHTTVSITRPTHEWADVVIELEWATKPDRNASDRADAERLMLLIEDQMPADYHENEGQATVALTEADLARLEELVGTIR